MPALPPHQRPPPVAYTLPLCVAEGGQAVKFRPRYTPNGGNKKKPRLGRIGHEISLYSSRTVSWNLV
jgi:hypothetical protein